jgi:hypothetical protein
MSHQCRSAAVYAMQVDNIDLRITPLHLPFSRRPLTTSTPAHVQTYRADFLLATPAGVRRAFSSSLKRHCDTVDFTLSSLKPFCLPRSQFLITAAIAKFKAWS